MSSLHRNKDTTRDEFIFYSKRLMRLLIEHALSFLPLKVSGHPWGTDVATSPPPEPLGYTGARLHPHSLLLPFLQSVTVETPQGTMYEGKRFHRERVRFCPGSLQARGCPVSGRHGPGKPGGSWGLSLRIRAALQGLLPPAAVPEPRGLCGAAASLARRRADVLSSPSRSQACPSCGQGRPWSRRSPPCARTSVWARS